MPNCLFLHIVFAGKKKQIMCVLRHLASALVWAAPDLQNTSTIALPIIDRLPQSAIDLDRCTPHSLLATAADTDELFYHVIFLCPLFSSVPSILLSVKG